MNDIEAQRLADEIMSEINSVMNTMMLGPILSKNWQPKHEYVEVTNLDGSVEKIIRKEDIKEHIKNGWYVSRLSKLSPVMVKKKWVNAIIAMEKEND